MIFRRLVLEIPDNPARNGSLWGNGFLFFKKKIGKSGLSVDSFRFRLAAGCGSRFRPSGVRFLPVAHLLKNVHLVGLAPAIFTFLRERSSPPLVGLEVDSAV